MKHQSSIPFGSRQQSTTESGTNSVKNDENSDDNSNAVSDLETNKTNNSDNHTQIQLTEDNLTYNMWRFDDLNVLIRCKIHGVVGPGPLVQILILN